MSIHHGKLHHKTPGWALDNARFHIRIRAETGQSSLTTPDFAARLLSSIAFYHEHDRWYAWLAVIMPDHLHALLSFAPETNMSRTVGEWKRYHERATGIRWQAGFFDHRLRSEESFVEKAHYLRMNPVRSGLCATPNDWPWIVEPWQKSS